MQNIDETSEVAENKVFILYFLHRLNIPVGNIQFIKIMLENRFMNYFYLQQYLGELADEGLVYINREDGRTFYGITEKGVTILEMFESILPAGLRKRLEQSIAPLRRSIRMETQITADYTPDGEDGYTVVCKIKENDFSLLEVKIAAGSREDARNICRYWTGFPQEIYSEILESLIRERKREENT